MEISSGKYLLRSSATRKPLEQSLEHQTSETDEIDGSKAEP
jgi:hypothetical protein